MKARLGVGPQSERYLIFRCPGCGDIHAPRISGQGKHWRWNGSLDAPTLAPSIEARLTSEDVCHVVVLEGKAHIMSDSTRNPGLILPLPDFRG